jgi:hypothetical protein
MLLVLFYSLTSLIEKSQIPSAEMLEKKNAALLYQCVSQRLQPSQPIPLMNEEFF